MDKKKQETVKNPHDAFFQHVFSDRNVAISFLQGALPEKIKRHINYQSVNLSSDTYTTSQLKKRFSDLVYDAESNNKNPLKLSLIFEHKSFLPAYNLYEQLLQYITASIQVQRGQNAKQLALPISIVLYHGRETWHDKPLREIFGNVPNDLQGFVPEFKYVLVDISNYSDDKIKQVFQSLQLQVVIATMRDIYSNAISPLIEEALYLLVRTAGESEAGRQVLQFLIALLNYLLSSSREKYEHIHEVIYETPKGEKIMNFIEQQLIEREEKGIQKGMQKGMQKGEKKGMQKGELLTKANTLLLMLENGFAEDKIKQVLKVDDRTFALLHSLYKKFGLKTIDHVKVEDGQLTMK